MLNILESVIPKDQKKMKYNITTLRCRGEKSFKKTPSWKSKLDLPIIIADFNFNLNRHVKNEF